MTTRPATRRPEALSLALGILLIFLGLFFAANQFLDFRIFHLAWPLYVFAPAALIFIFGMTLRNGAGEAVSVLGMMGMATGLLLFYQNVSNHWESWAYGWALVAPTAAGVANVFYGTFHGRTDLVRRGLRIAGVGLGIFLIGAFFFEFVIGFSGFRLGSLGIAILFIVLGVGVILRPLIFGSRESEISPTGEES